MPVNIVDVKTGEVLMKLNRDSNWPEVVEKIKERVPPGSIRVEMEDYDTENEAAAQKEKAASKKKAPGAGSEKNNTLNPQIAPQSAQTPNELDMLRGPGAPEVMAEGPALPVKEHALPKRA